MHLFVCKVCAKNRILLTDHAKSKLKIKYKGYFFYKHLKWFESISFRNQLSALSGRSFPQKSWRLIPPTDT